VQSWRDGVTRYGEAVIAGGLRWRPFDETERREGVEACGPGAVQGAPTRRQRVDALIGEQDNERLRARAVCAAQEEGAHGQGPGGAGPQRVRNRRQRFVAVMDPLCGGWRGRQGGLEHGAALEVGRFGRRVLLDRQRQGARHERPCTPGSDAQLCCPRHELLQCALGVGARMGGEGVVLLSAVRRERGPFRGPGGPDCLGPDRMPTQDRAATRIRKHLRHLWSEAGQVPGPVVPHFVKLRLRHRRNGMEPLLGAVFAWLPVAQAPGADEGERVDATPGVDRGALRRQGLRRLRRAGQDCERDRLAVRVPA